MIRAFLAIGLAEAIQERYAVCLERDRGLTAPLRWVRPENLHLTLRFLGDVSEDRLHAVVPRVEEVAGRIAPFRCDLGEAGCFGNLASPNVLWLDVREGAESLRDLHGGLEREVRSMGFPRDTKPWRSHLTLARNPRRASFGRWKELLDGWELTGLGWDVCRVTLYSSVLGSQGPTYSVVSEAALKGEVENR